MYISEQWQTAQDNLFLKVLIVKIIKTIKTMKNIKKKHEKAQDLAWNDTDAFIQMSLPYIS